MCLVVVVMGGVIALAPKQAPTMRFLMLGPQGDGQQDDNYLINDICLLSVWSL